MPEPMTMAARKALPRNSASSRRHKMVSLIGPGRPSPTSSRRSAAGRGLDVPAPTDTGVPATASGTQHEPSPAMPVSAGASARTV